MGDRFYFQQIQTLGSCPGKRTNKRNRRMAWDDDKKAQAVEMYEAAEPTPETSMEVVKEIADELGESPNGVRMILTKAGVYVKRLQHQVETAAMAAVLLEYQSKLHKMHLSQQLTIRAEKLTKILFLS